MSKSLYGSTKCWSQFSRHNTTCGPSHNKGQSDAAHHLLQEQANPNDDLNNDQDNAKKFRKLIRPQLLLKEPTRVMIFVCKSHAPNFERSERGARKQGLESDYLPTKRRNQVEGISNQDISRGDEVAKVRHQEIPRLPSDFGARRYHPSEMTAE
jgi:hypothetical protein